jgi:hypothetical protein
MCPPGSRINLIPSVVLHNKQQPTTIVIIWIFEDVESLSADLGIFVLADHVDFGTGTLAYSRSYYERKYAKVTAPCVAVVALKAPWLALEFSNRFRKSKRLFWHFCSRRPWRFWNFDLFSFILRTRICQSYSAVRRRLGVQSAMVGIWIFADFENRSSDFGIFVLHVPWVLSQSRVQARLK